MSFLYIKNRHFSVTIMQDGNRKELRGHRHIAEKRKQKRQTSKTGLPCKKQGQNKTLAPEMRKASKSWLFWIGSGGWIRTNDLRVMSPTSYQTAPPRIKLFVNWVAPVNVARILPPTPHPVNRYFQTNRQDSSTPEQAQTNLHKPRRHPAPSLPAERIGDAPGSPQGD